MYKLYTGILITCLFLFPNQAFAQNVDLTVVEHTIEQRIKSGNLVGLFAGYVAPDGTTSSFGKGTLVAEGDNKITEHSIFEIGSISKVFTTLLLAQIMEEGGITLGDEAEKLLPKGMVLPEFGDEKILVRHLVTHTSGLPTFPDNIFPEDSSDPYANYTIEEFADYLKETKLSRAPGEQFEYSNMGMALIGHILETQTGKEYEELVKERIAEPLKMQSTFIEIPAGDSSRLARGHSNGNTVSNWNLPTFEAAGALRSTGSDMIKFLRVQIGLIDNDLYPAVKKTQNSLFDIKQGKSKQTDKIGMGWFYTTDKDTIIWHTGGTGGYRTFIGINLATGSGAVVLSNSTANISDIYFHLVDSDYKLREMKKDLSLSNNHLDRFVGKYKSQMGFSFYVTSENDQLFIRLTGQSKASVQSTSKNTFVNRQLGAEFTFNTTGNGEVTGLTLRQNGQEISAKKVGNTVSEPNQKEAIYVGASVLKRYVGSYQLTPTFRIKVTLGDEHLYAQASGQQKFPVYPESRTKFFYKAVEAQLEFIENKEGEFNTVKLYQAGRVLEGTKIDQN